MTRTARADLRRIDNTVSKHLVMYRAARRISQTELGALTGVTFQQIQKYEKGSNSMPSGRMRMICNALGVTPNDLFGITTDADGNRTDVNGHSNGGATPTLSPWAYKLAFKLEELGPTMRLAVSHLVDGLVEHAAQEASARQRKTPMRR